MGHLEKTTWGVVGGGRGETFNSGVEQTWGADSFLTERRQRDAVFDWNLQTSDSSRYSYSSGCGDTRTADNSQGRRETNMTFTHSSQNRPLTGEDKRKIDEVWGSF